MTPTLQLLRQRNFLPLFVTQFLNAFNDNLFKTAIVMLVTYEIYADPAREAIFNAVAAAVFILPFFLFSAVAGQLADWRDKAVIIRAVKSAEIGIMAIGACGLLLQNIPLMLVALFAMGVHSSFFGPIKYAILPQHLAKDEVLPGTGLVEAGTYIAILMGTIMGGVLQGLIRQDIIPDWSSAAAIMVLAVIGRFAGAFVPTAPPLEKGTGLDWHIIRSSIALVSRTMHIRRLFLAIIAISFFWGMAAILAAQFPPLVKNLLRADESVATLALSIFSVGVAIGSVAVNRLLKGQVSARYSPVSALVMGVFLLLFYWLAHTWEPGTAKLLTLGEFLSMGQARLVIFALFGVAVSGGMFVVPLYAFLTTTVAISETARTVAANNIVNSGAMVLATGMLTIALRVGVSVADTLLIVAIASVGAAAIAQMLHRACD